MGIKMTQIQQTTLMQRITESALASVPASTKDVLELAEIINHNTLAQLKSERDIIKRITILEGAIMQ
jgi:hypothetical protein